MSDRFTLEDGKYGCRAVLKSSWSLDLSDYFAEKGVVELELNIAKGWRGADIEFLASLPFLKAFEIFNFGIKSIAPIHCLHELRRLGITTYCSTEIDFSAFPHLESCGLEWRPKASSLFRCTTLKRLFVNRFKGKDADPFANLVALESLGILNAPIANLLGLRFLTRLEKLRLGGLRRLGSLAGIEGLARLEELEINTCRAIRSINEVSTLPRLRRLYLNNCGEIDSLKPLAALTGLEAMCFSDSTKIVDGDLTPLLSQKNLTRVSFQNRRHYTNRKEEFGWK